MKKILLILMITVLIISCIAPAAIAEEDKLAAAFQERLDLLDHFYNYNAYYMYVVVCDDFLVWGDDIPQASPIPAADFEASLHKYFVIDDSIIDQIRKLDNGSYYNAIDNTYTVEWLGGFGGSLPDREYLGYIKNDATYDVYYRHLTYGFLEDVLPDGVDEFDYAEALGWPETIEYNGVVYTDGMEGYTAILSRDSFGRKYTVEMNGDVVRIISCIEYNEDEQPDSFDDGKSSEAAPAPETTLAPETTKTPETTTAPETTLTPETNAPNSSGCGSVISGIPAIIAFICLTAAFVSKKKG